MTRSLLGLVLSGGLVALTANTPVTLAQSAGEGKYQIVKSTENRVWRLNKETGEIAVCDLDGSNLVCTTSSDAAEVPKKTYEQLEAEKAAAAKALEEEKQAELEQELKLLDKAMTLIREFIDTAIGNSATN